MGPTASGKTALSLKLADTLGSEIISVDSALVYQAMDIGTAKPTVAERGTIPHHLIDILAPSEAYSTGQFRDQATALIEQQLSVGQTPLLTGGTQLYFSALTDGLAQLPPADPRIRLRLDQLLLSEGKAYLHQQLQAVDPIAAARIHMNDPQRVQRALEVYEITGEPLSSFFNESSESPYQFLKIILSPEDRSVLHRRIESRFLDMLHNGLIEEVESLRQRGDLHLGLPSMRCVGYRQVWQYLDGEFTKDEMIDHSVAASRQLAKRQLTWLRKHSDALWFDHSEQAYPSTLQAIQRRLEN